ncbi:MAG: hypothetical protein J5654_09640 [Victivallales bacterium]|nr:hypothetical protein [Victivallales bacterium]
MAEEMNGYTPVEHKEYASKGMAGSALGIGIGALVNSVANGGVLGGVLGGRPLPPQQDSISRREAGLMMENALLKANQNTCEKLSAYKDQQNAINMKQVEVNATQSAAIACAQKSIDLILGSFQLMMPNRNIAPGWGPSFYSPFPPAPFVPASNGGTAATTTAAENG